MALIALVVVGCGLAAWRFAAEAEADRKVEGRDAPVSVAPKKVNRNARGRKVPRAKSQRIEETAVPVQKTRVKPAFELDAEAESLLSEAQRELIKAIRESLASNDFKRLRALVHKLQSSPEWPDGIPVAIRKAAISALAWFGAQGLPEIAGFLGDSDETVVKESYDAYEGALFDANGDRELSSLLVMACKVVNDSNAINTFYMRFMQMRNSVTIDTMKQIMATGTDAAKAALPMAIECFTGEDGLKTAADLDKWYNDPSGDNLDGPNAEDFYGPQNW